MKRDYLQEKGLARILLEHGSKQYDDSMSIADFIRLKVGDADFENELWKNIYHVYYAQLDESLQYPDEKFFTYHDIELIRTAAIEALYFPYELSIGWEEKHHIATPTKEMTYLQDVNDTVTFFLLRKIRNMHKELFDELREVNDTNHDEVMVLQLAINELKKTEANLLLPMKSVMTK